MVQSWQNRYFNICSIDPDLWMKVYCEKKKKIHWCNIIPRNIRYNGYLHEIKTCVILASFPVSFDMVAHCRVKSVWKRKKKISIKVVAWFCICCKLKKKNKMTKKRRKIVLRQLLQNWTHFCFLSCTKMLSLATMHIVIIHRGWSSSLTHSAIL